MYINYFKLISYPQIANLQTEFESVEEELNKVYMEEELKKEILARNRNDMTNIRRGDDGDDAPSNTTE